MRGNDLDNIVVPRDVLVFEGLLGLVKDKKTEDQVNKWLKRKRWGRAVELFEINEMFARRIWYVAKTFSYELDVVTYIGGPEFAKALETRLQDHEHLPVKRIWFDDPNLLARRLAIDIDIRFIYDIPARSLMYGSKGRSLLPEEHNLLGV